MENRLLDLTSDLNKKYDSIVFSNQKKTGESVTYAIWLYDKHFPRGRNVLAEIYDKRANKIDFVMQRSLLTSSEDAEAQKDPRTTPGRGFFSKTFENDSAFLQYLDEKLKKYYQLMQYKPATDLPSLVYPIKPRGKEFMIDKNLILYGPPGTGKTYTTVIYAVAILENKTIVEIHKEKYNAVVERYKRYMEAGRVVFLTFHQSFGYEEFIEGIKPVVDEEKKEISYKIEDGIFKKICNTARQALEGTANENFVLIIDEINRGNISKIFGELITLIEPTKREGMPEAMSATLPYSKDAFCVPQNLYLLGTMNTADRSIALMDTALRRRFSFVEMLPNPQVLVDIGADKVGDLNVAQMLKKINERIAFLYDREHTIGHAFFTKLKDDPSLDVLAEIFTKSIIPLLQEYFYDDYAKIQLVLGDNAKRNDEFKFIKDETIIFSDVFNGNVDDIVDLPEKKYTINHEAFYQMESYLQI